MPLLTYLIAFAFALALPIASYAVYATLAFAKAERQRLEQEARDTAHDLVRQVDREHSSQIAMLQALATSPALEVNNIASFDRQAKNLAATGGYQIALIGMDGTHISNTRYAFGAPNMPKSSQIVDYLQGKSIDEPRIIDLFRGARTDRPITATAIPVTINVINSILIALIVDPIKFQSIIMDQNVNSPYYATILDKNNRVIARSEKFETYLGVEPPRNDARIGPKGRWEGTNLQGLSVVSFYETSELSGWRINVSIDKAALAAPINRSLKEMGLIAALMLIVAILLSFLVSRQIALGSNMLVVAAKAVGQGKYVQRLVTPIKETNVVLNALSEASLGLQERSAALAAQRAAEEETQASTAFLTAMSHEIRTPLHAIIGYTDLALERSALPRGARRELGIVRNASTSLLAIVDEVLTYSGMLAGGVELEYKPFAPAEPVESAIAIIRGVGTEKGLEIKGAVAPDTPRWLMGDRQRLLQILINLLNNAVKFTERGSVTLEVNADPSHDGLTRLRCAVVDTGVGIPPEHYDRLFRRFSQGDGSIQRSYGGSGLGLAICKRIIDAMDGEIGFKSEVGRGSTFFIEVPLGVADVQPVPSLGLLEPQQPRRGHILVVDDLPLNLELARTILERSGYEVDTAGSGEAALRILRQTRIDLVLMDVQMPEMDGMAATKAIRQLGPAFQKLPIIAMTADVIPADVVRFMREGMDDHLAKPFKPEALRSLITKWLTPEDKEANRALVDLFEGATYRELLELIGYEKTEQALRELRTAITDSFLSSADPSNMAQMARLAHKLAPQAGLLGLKDLASALIAFDQAVTGNGPIARAFSELCSASSHACERINHLLAVLSDNKPTRTQP